MRIAVYLAHPRPGSFNGALFGAVVDELRTHAVEVLAHDLYAEGFDPMLGAAETETVDSTRAGDDLIRRYQDELSELDAMIFVHPNWWGMPPAILTGWVQRVLTPAVAYKLNDAAGEPIPLLRAERALVLNTSDTTADRERDVFGDPLGQIWASCVLPYIGVKDMRRKVFRTVTDSSEQTRAAWLREARALAAALATDG
ncbi:putative NADPH-quinone reductase [Nocardia tenerifensis]|uniref:Putative NADPH-quinone reductase n=1 Tax=Nocardia tenerifensis TaxID=228006 RepID=A0A318K0Q3_9NOCA|nr:NAD(P)H-dependent oxidoreductase [Nocardia tenerifensis]PXX61551.1 putative NADPH-quinone reductase [Nocardia tenerifensis]